MKILLLTIFFVFSVCFSSQSQTQIAIPKIVNYSVERYKGGIQNWDIAQDKTGILYFANNEGLLSFNGQFWNLYHLPNNTSVRSVEIDSKRRVFVGGQDEIGYFYPDGNGVLKYHSLMNLLPPRERKLADVWNIAILNDVVFFRSTNKIIAYKNGMLRIFKPAVEWQFLTRVGG